MRMRSGPFAAVWNKKPTADRSVCKQQTNTLYDGVHKLTSREERPAEPPCHLRTSSAHILVLERYGDSPIQVHRLSGGPGHGLFLRAEPLPDQRPHLGQSRILR